MSDFTSRARDMDPKKKPKGLSLGSGFQLFEYLGLGLGILQISN